LRFDGTQLSRYRELDANDRRDAGGLELAPGVAEEGLNGGSIEPAADLIGSRDGEVLARGGENAAAFELVLEGFALGFGAFKDCVGVADRVGEGFVRKIMESAIAGVAWAMGLLRWLGLGPLRCSLHLGGPTILCYP
jgi:hypothetical protein